MKAKINKINFEEGFGVAWQTSNLAERVLAPISTFPPMSAQSSSSEPTRNCRKCRKSYPLSYYAIARGSFDRMKTCPPCAVAEKDATAKRRSHNKENQPLDEPTSSTRKSTPTVPSLAVDAPTEMPWTHFMSKLADALERKESIAGAYVVTLPDRLVWEEGPPETEVEGQWLILRPERRRAHDVAAAVRKASGFRFK